MRADIVERRDLQGKVSGMNPRSKRNMFDSEFL
jgi:hypothetical protein